MLGSSNNLGYLNNSVGFFLEDVCDIGDCLWNVFEKLEGFLAMEFLSFFSQIISAKVFTLTSFSTHTEIAEGYSL